MQKKSSVIIHLKFNNSVDVAKFILFNMFSSGLESLLSFSTNIFFFKLNYPAFF